MRGENFLINFDGEDRLLGFYQNVFVEEDDADKAELQAAEIIKKSDLTEIALPEKNEQAMLHLEELYELEEFEVITDMLEGRAFFPMSDLDKKWWQFWK